MSDIPYPQPDEFYKELAALMNAGPTWQNIQWEMLKGLHSNLTLSVIDTLVEECRASQTPPETCATSEGEQ